MLVGLIGLEFVDLWGLVVWASWFGFLEFWLMRRWCSVGGFVSRGDLGGLCVVVGFGFEWCGFGFVLGVGGYCAVVVDLFVGACVGVVFWV